MSELQQTQREGVFAFLASATLLFNESSACSGKRQDPGFFNRQSPLFSCKINFFLIICVYM